MKSYQTRLLETGGPQTLLAKCPPVARIPEVMITKPLLFACACLGAFAVLADDLNLNAPHGGPGEAHPIRRNYAPDRSAGFSHMSLDITPSFEQHTITGKVVFNFKPVAKSLDQLELNASDMTIDGVESSAKIQAWQYAKDKLIVTFAEAIPAGQDSTLSIRYHAQPVKGLYFRTPDMGYKAGDEHLFTQGEAIDNRYWYPCPDEPIDKYTTEVTCHVPEGMTVLSNGRLVSNEKDGAGLNAFHWSQEKPHANYLVSLVAGYFKSVEDKHNDTPLAMYVPPSDIAEAPNSFVDTKDIMDFFEHEIGVPFPWAKYYQVLVQDFMEGGMENTSLTTETEFTLFTPATENLHSSQGLVSHEMAHQWFGDLVTCKDWSQIWLNEGFATYYSTLYDGHKDGEDAMLYNFYKRLRSLTSSSNTAPIVNRKFESPDDIFGSLVYDKASYVLRMLRTQLGADLYRKCIKTYLERHQYGSVVTEDLSDVIEELSGKSYDQFFDQWMYHGLFPQLSVSYSWDEKTKLAKITIQQTQAVNDEVLLFDFPLNIAFKGKSGRIEKTVTVKQTSEDFYFALPEAPDQVRLDPRVEVLAKITIDLPPAMIAAELADDSDVVARLDAVASLRDKKDHATIDQLSRALNHDPFYGVRIDAASALASMRSDESLKVLIASLDQKDARVRNAVASGIAAFYKPAAKEAVLKALASEQNPDIEAQYIRGLANYSEPEIHDRLLTCLKSQSYRNRLTEAAISTMRTQDDAAYAEPIRKALEERRADFTTGGVSSALDAIAFLSRNDERKDFVRGFLIAFLNDKNVSIRNGAIRALGTLGDARAIAVLQTFANASREIPEQAPAEAAIQSIRSNRKQGDNLKDLRDTVSDLQKENRQLRKDLDTLQKKFEAIPELPPAKKSKKQSK